MNMKRVTLTHHHTFDIHADMYLYRHTSGCRHACVLFIQIYDLIILPANELTYNPDTIP